jgi:hypothetical protein
VGPPLTGGLAAEADGPSDLAVVGTGGRSEFGGLAKLHVDLGTDQSGGCEDCQTYLSVGPCGAVWPGVSGTLPGDLYGQFRDCVTQLLGRDPRQLVGFHPANSFNPADNPPCRPD